MRWNRLGLVVCVLWPLCAGCGATDGVATGSSADLVQSDSLGVSETDPSAGDVSAIDAGADPGDVLVPKDVAAACVCGDGVCNPACETAVLCAKDCATCGDGACSAGENPDNCKKDCCGTCGDGKCRGPVCGETPDTCAKDCGATCGNGTCDKGETPATCKPDCAWLVCGNHVCELADGGPAGCPADCGATCGDCECQGTESWESCPLDCGFCGDGVCSICPGLDESAAGCKKDCPLSGPCDDGTACTIDSQVGLLCSHTPDDLACEDGNACTLDACVIGKGCVSAPSAAACDDGNACTEGDACVAGQCAGSALDCDDGNACTTDGCVPSSGCAHTPNISACDDGDLCTKGDVCAAGACVGAPVSCDDGNVCTDDGCDAAKGCVHLPGSATCDDGNACTTGDACSGGACLAAPIDCDDANACTNDGCDPATGCAHVALTAVCDDADACTKGDACVAGVCVGKPMKCNDFNACTDDACDGTKGCVFLPNAATCDDGSACTEGDACEGGACKGTKISCDDGNGCTQDACDLTTGCTHAVLTGACDDGDLCTNGDTCVGGACLGSKQLCDDGNLCTLDACDPKSGKCVTLPVDPTPCDDGDPCTTEDACSLGVCAGAPVVCATDNPCAASTCEFSTGNCVLSLKQAAGACDDGNPCTMGDLCQLVAGTPLCTGSAKVCNKPWTPCSQWYCDTSTGDCTEKTVTGPCNDGNACTLDETCNASGACVPKAYKCDDGNPCTSDLCDKVTGVCSTAPYDNVGCDDGDPCTTGDQCKGGQCAGTNTKCQCVTDSDCAYLDDGNLCNGSAKCLNKLCYLDYKMVSCAPQDYKSCFYEECNPTSGACEVLSRSDGAFCDDSDDCTTSGQCVGGQCKGIVPVVCQDKECSTVVCKASAGCTYTLTDGAPCNDGNACTAGDACLGGVCKPGVVISCDDSQPCTQDGCSASTGCYHNTGGKCDDSNACTTFDTCQVDLTCQGVPKLCTTNNSCMKASCDPAKGCVEAPDPDGWCSSDGDACTDKDACVEGVCKGTPVDCNDAYTCTTDTCESLGAGCTHARLVPCSHEWARWPISADKSDANYVLNAPTGTALDKTTGLMWIRAPTPVTSYSKGCVGYLLGGFSDWRFPTFAELSTLIKLPPTVNGVMVNTTVFLVDKYSNLCSATPLAGTSSYYYGFMPGGPTIKSPSGCSAALCVRGGDPVSQVVDQFVVLDATSVKDNKTGLQWRRDFSGALSSYTQGADYCAGLPTSVGAWRMPTTPELASILDLGKTQPAIDTNLFPGTPAEPFFSSSSGNMTSPSFPYGPVPYVTWVDFAVGAIRRDPGTPASGRVRCVK